MRRRRPLPIRRESTELQSMFPAGAARAYSRSTRIRSPTRIWIHLLLRRPTAAAFISMVGPSNPLSSAFQEIDVSSAATLIDPGTLRYALSAWIGGYSSQEDNTVLTVQFRSWSGTVLGSVTLGPVNATDRNNTSSLLQRSQSGAVPSGT